MDFDGLTLEWAAQLAQGALALGLRTALTVGDTVARVQRVHNAFLKTFGIGRTVSKADSDRLAGPGEFTDAIRAPPSALQYGC